jgi:hypothetical protein
MTRMSGIDSNADFFRSGRFGNIRSTGRDVNQGDFPNDLVRSFIQQTERCYRVCRIRLCRRDRTRRVLGLSNPRLKAPGGPFQPRAFSCLITTASAPSKIRTARSGDAADRKILAHQSRIIRVGIHMLARRALAHGMAIAPAVSQHATFVGLRRRRAVLRRAQFLRAITGVGLQRVVAKEIKPWF